MKKQVQKIKENKGFSMIELIIVVAIMAILVGIIGAALIPYMEKSRASKDKATLDAVYTAFGNVISETDNASLTTVDPHNNKSLWELVGVADEDALKAKFKSKQFSNAGTVEIKFFLDGDNYGVCVTGQNDYTGVMIDNSGKEYKTGVKIAKASGTSVSATTTEDGTAFPSTAD